LPKRVRTVWEPAQGRGDMVQALRLAGLDVIGSDIATNHDFLLTKGPVDRDAIITNPPNSLAPEFIAHALKLTRSRGVVVAMLLKIDFDCAHTLGRVALFEHPFTARIVLRNRIIW
jgi:hypothetical protein